MVVFSHATTVFFFFFFLGVPAAAAPPPWCPDTRWSPRRTVCRWKLYKSKCARPRWQVSIDSIQLDSLSARHPPSIHTRPNTHTSSRATSSATLAPISTHTSDAPGASPWRIMSEMRTGRSPSNSKPCMLISESGVCVCVGNDEWVGVCKALWICFKDGP
jgi:hypothetical protein